VIRSPGRLGANQSRTRQRQGGAGGARESAGAPPGPWPARGAPLSPPAFSPRATDVCGQIGGFFQAASPVGCWCSLAITPGPRPSW